MTKKKKKKDYANFLMASALKDLGYKDPCDHYWHGYELIASDVVLNYNATESKISAPHFYDILRWLRKVHKISVRINYLPSQKKWFYDLLKLDNKPFFGGEDYYYEGTDLFDSYEEALSDGIDQGWSQVMMKQMMKKKK